MFYLIFSLHQITSNKFRARIGAILKKYMGQNMWVENPDFEMFALIKSLFKGSNEGAIIVNFFQR